MSGLRVPVFFGSILTLVVLVIQNRTPVFEITLLGFRSQPLPLGLLVAIAVTAGIILGAILQRIGGRRIARKSPPAASETYSGPAEFQTFRSIPEPSNEDFDSPDQTHEEADTAPPSRPMSSDSTSKGWDTEMSSSWTEQSEKMDEEGRFWSRSKPSSRPGSVTPFNRKRKQDKSPAKSNNPDSVYEAEYRFVTPDPQSKNQGNNDGFDDDFFDDFFDEEAD